jgi:hypothetical protein
MVRVLSASVFVLLFISNTFGQNISANAFTDTSDYLVGDYINLNIKVKYEKGINVQNPSIKEILNNLELIKSEEPFLSKEDDKAVVLFKYIISKYDSGDVELPPIPVLFKSSSDTILQIAYTNPVSFTVHTLTVEPALEIKDVKEPIRIPLEWWIILIYAAAVLIAAAVVYYIYKKYKEKKEKKIGLIPEPQIPSYITALNSLHELEEQQLWQRGLVKEYHSKITEIIRRYFEERFYLPALELTTNEALYKLKQRNDSSEIIDVTEQFLNNADLVKFAKYKPLPSVNEEMMKQAYLIVEKTIPEERSDKREVLRNAG